MTPQEKAKEIVERYYTQGIDFFYKDTQDGDCIGSSCMTYKSAKECAKIHGRGIIELVSVDFTINQKGKLEFWQEVLTEIYNL